MSMANNNSGQNGSGLLWLLIIFWVGGNIALFDGSFSDMPVLCGLTVIADIIGIVAIINSLVDRSHSSTANAQRTATISPTTNELRQLKANFRVSGVPSVDIPFDSLQKELESFQCTEVLQSVRKVLSVRRGYAEKMKALKRDIDEILACSNCSTENEQISYIKTNMVSLQQMTEAYNAASYELSKTRVTLLSKDQDSFDRLLSALSTVSKSHKSESASGVELDSFLKLKSSIPGNLFRCTQAPVELNFGEYRFFLLPDVVLAYTSSGSFVTALNPMALIITFAGRIKVVSSSTFGSGTWHHYDTLISQDSVCVSTGDVSTRWRYQRRDGGPDMRYSNNSRYEVRSDRYSYTGFSIQIGQYKADYSLSKGDVADKLKTMVKDYCSAMHETNTIPSLLRLFESLAKNESNARFLSEKYENLTNSIICKVD